MDPISGFSALKAVGAAASGIAGRASAMNQSAQAELNAKLAETQGLQRDTLSREELQRAESATRAARGANNLSGDSPNAALLFKERRGASDRDRLIQRSDDQLRAQNYRTAAAGYRRRGTMSLFTGFVNSGVPLLQAGF